MVRLEDGWLHGEPLKVLPSIHFVQYEVPAGAAFGRECHLSLRCVHAGNAGSHSLLNTSPHPVRKPEPGDQPSCNGMTRSKSYSAWSFDTYMVLNLCTSMLVLEEVGVRFGDKCRLESRAGLQPITALQIP